MSLRPKTINNGGNQWKTVEKRAVSLAVCGISAQYTHVGDEALQKAVAALPSL